MKADCCFDRGRVPEEAYASVYNARVEVAASAIGTNRIAHAYDTNDSHMLVVFDAEDRLVSVTSALQTNGAVRVLNRYDHRHRRVLKTVQRYVVATNTAASKTWMCVTYTNF